ncbi:MAG: YgiQ family radical SAM protein [Desulfosalsimonadaceae bacterium]
MFLPATKKEAAALGWEALDVILVNGDAYIDAPHIGISVIGKTLVRGGFRVGIISQPDTGSAEDICRLGEPLLFWGVSAGCMDSMIANYTATKRPRKQDDLTAGGRNTRRPDRAAIVYTNLIRRHFKKTVPIVLGGIEASLRRISHYDYWSGRVRRSVLFDAKADILVYGMGEKAVLELARRLAAAEPVHDVGGICWISAEKPEGFIELPAHDVVKQDVSAFRSMFASFYKNNEPKTAEGLVQKQDSRYLIHNPPQPLPATEELDRIHEAGYERELGPFDRQFGTVRALDTIRFSIRTHRGCYGECHFCAIAVHEGRTIVERSLASLMREAREMRRHPLFKGVIQDVGGPTANMYGIECQRKRDVGPCRDRRCLTPEPCRHLPVDHRSQIRLLENLRKIEGVKRVFVSSGIRHDMILADRSCGDSYLELLVRHHISGQLKIAPEHSEAHVLSLMGKPDIEKTRRFIGLFREKTRQLRKKRFLTCYFIAAYPGCSLEDMRRLKDFTARELRFRPEQVQIFTPSPSTIAALMYYSEISWPDNRPIFVEETISGKEKQKRELQKRD